MEFRFCRFTNRYAECKKFYTSIGFKIVAEWDRGLIDKGTVFRLYSGYLELLLSEEHYAAEASSAYIYAEVADIAILNKVRERVAVVTGQKIPIYEKPWGHLQLSFRDPDDFVVRIFSRNNT